MKIVQSIIKGIEPIGPGRIGQFFVPSKKLTKNSIAYKDYLLSQGISPYYFDFTQFVLPEIYSGGAGLQHLSGSIDLGEGITSMLKSKMGVGDRNAILRSGQTGQTMDYPVIGKSESFVMLGNPHREGTKYYTGESVEGFCNNPVQFVMQGKRIVLKVSDEYKAKKTQGTLIFYPGSLNLYESLLKQAYQFGEAISFDTGTSFLGIVGARTGLYDYGMLFNPFGVNHNRVGYQASIQASLVMHSLGKQILPQIPTNAVAHSWGGISFVAEYAKYMYVMSQTVGGGDKISLPINHIILVDPRNPSWALKEMEAAVAYLSSLGVVFSAIHDTKHFDWLNPIMQTQSIYSTSHVGGTGSGVNFHVDVSTGHAVASMKPEIIKVILKGLAAFKVQEFDKPE